MSELSNYIELLLRDDMPKEAKYRLAEMIKDAELHLRPSVGVVTSVHTVNAPGKMNLQAPSTLAAMARHGIVQDETNDSYHNNDHRFGSGNIRAEQPSVQVTLPPAPEPVAVVAQTPQTAAALNSRNEAINAALSGKIDKTRGSPRKF